MKVYVALNSVPDYNSGPPSFKSVHTTLLGAIKALYPEATEEKFYKWTHDEVWVGPDGFGMVKAVELHDSLDEEWTELSLKASRLAVALDQFQKVLNIM